MDNAMEAMHSQSPEQGSAVYDVAIVGGGLAGLATACALADAGQHVCLLERRPYVGGRASSYEHPGTGEVVDNCQHILLGCCTNLINFYQRLGVADRIRWFDRITFLEPGGRHSVLSTGMLPAPLHSARSFLFAPMLSSADKLAIGRGMMSFLRGLPADTAENFAHWLERHKQTRGAVDRFWRPVMVSALNEDLDRISIRYAGKVVRESFMGSAVAGHMGVPTIPLSELYGHAVEYIRARGGEVRLRTGVEALALDANTQRWSVRTQDGLAGQGSGVQAEAVVLALPFEAVQKLLPTMPPLPAGVENTLQCGLGHFEHSPITGIHLWFDRKITDLEHAALLDRTVQWMYHKSLLQPQTRSASSGDYIELVVSASKTLVPMQRQEIIDLALRELAEFFPIVREAKLFKATVVKEVRATFSVTPGLDAYRPGPVTAWPGTFLAGDWTATGWPATMEGAVRSGHLAAEAVMRSLGHEQKFLQPDLPMQGLMRLFG
ncbi:MAG: hydroxysqualene dehydroxylase HpnE [Acidobacteriaceae bacterium]